MITSGQQKALSLLPIVPASLSILGSSIIIWRVVQQAQIRCYERILVGLSLSDIILSLTLVAMNFLSPQGAMVWSIGNVGSCAALGTFYQLGAFSAGLYNASLSVYYFLTIRHGVSQAKMARYIEPFLHGISILFPLSTALWGLAIQAYDYIPSLGLCWVNCGAECNSTLLRYIFASPIMVAWVTIGAAMCGIWLHVRATIRQHDGNSTVLKIREQQAPASQTSVPSSERKNLSLVATQALLYVGSFSMISVWPIALSVIEQHESIQSISQNPKTAPWLFAMMACCAIFFPMSGFFNCFIYIRPRYLVERSKRLEESRWQTLHRVLWKPQTTKRSSISASGSTISPSRNHST